MQLHEGALSPRIDIYGILREPGHCMEYSCPCDRMFGKIIDVLRGQPRFLACKWEMSV